MLRSTRGQIDLQEGGERGQTDGDDKVVEVEEIDSEGGSQVFVEGKVGSIEECLSHGMKDLFHDCDIPCCRVETGMSDLQRWEGIRKETLEEACSDDDEKEKEYCRFFNHFLQYDEHGPEKAKEVEI